MYSSWHHNFSFPGHTEILHVMTTWYHNIFGLGP